MSRYARKRLFVSTTLLIGVVCAAGCEDRSPPDRYSVLAGKVVACRTDTGELSVRGLRRTAEGPTEETIHCLITRGSEIYVNDKFSSIGEIQLGDAVELVGRRDSDPRLEHFVVSFAYFDRPLPAPPRPELKPASTPATTDATDQRE
ncbi:MAG: hypothetical protein ACE5I3_10540 [Phycisphaerae bacterium]